MPWRYLQCRKHFSAKTKTIFARSNLSYHKCLLAIYLLTTAKKGISSHQLAKQLGCPQKTVWHLAHRIRKCMEQGEKCLKAGWNRTKLGLTGGKGTSTNPKRAKRPWNHRQANSYGVMGRGDEVRAQPVRRIDKTALQNVIKTNILPGYSVFTDELKSYEGIQGYRHQSVKHSVGEYVRGKAHTNGIESFWALLKRGYHGVYPWISCKHMHRYVNEFTTRFNRRKLGTEVQLNASIRGMENKSLPYKALTA